MEIVKKTDKELQLKNESRAYLYTENLDDGGIYLHNSDKEKPKIKLSPDQVNSFADSLGARNKETHLTSDLRPYSILSTVDSYNSVKEGMQNPKIKENILKYFAELVEMGNKNKYISTKKNIGKDIASCILEYPKVIVEPHYTNDIFQMTEEFKEVEGIRLPFPKLTIISGEYTDIDMDRVMNSQASIVKRSQIQNGSVNMFYCYLLSEQPHGIDVDVFMARENNIGEMLYIATAVIIHNGVELQFITEDNGIEHVKAAFHTCVSSAVAAIYMMTMGKNNFYMSVPTLEEAATNRKRISKGKKPLIEFKVATIEGKKTMMSSTPHGTHASPRLHWRRGHWRTITKSGKKTWIAPMEVGDEDSGRIIKTYAIGKYSLMEAR